MLVKRVDESGFVFYTNHGSRKAGEIASNPRAALCFHWPATGIQARVEGPVTRTSDEESDRYFASRPRGSQLGAWASRQSRPLASRRRLVARYLRLKARFAGRPIPRPDFWGGYRLEPERIELWRHRRHRLHDRHLYVREGAGWRVERLYP